MSLLTSVCRHCGRKITKVTFMGGIGTRWVHETTGDWYCRITVAGPTVDL